MKETKGTTKSLGNKQAEDKFYTKPEVVDQILSKLQEKIDLSSYDVVIEPSAGSGAFSEALKNVHHNVQAFDLVPEHDNITQADWFKLDKSCFNVYEKKAIIGNPPFGTSGKLAVDFMKHGVFADMIGFVLPKGFMKESVQNRVPLDFHLTLEFELPKNSFTLEGENYDVPCVFQLWEKQDTMRVVRNRKVESKFLQFMKEASDSDFRVQRVGGNAGKASKNMDVSKASNYFVKNISDLSDDELIAVINSIVFPTIEHTTGPRSLPKFELIEMLNEAL